MTAHPCHAQRLIAICRANDVAMVRVFGSMARGEATAQSAIDLLVEFAQRESLLALARLERERPVCLRWPSLDWPLPAGVGEKMVPVLRLAQSAGPVLRLAQSAGLVLRLA